jgi:carboxypeptidase Taq
MEKKFAELKNRLLEVADIGSVNAVLGWDQLTCMPPGGAATRARQQARFARMAQEKFIDPAIGKLLDDLRPYEESLPYEHDDASLIRVARRDYELAIKVPPEFMSRLNEHQSQAYMAWAEARPANDFGKVRPFLEKMVDLSREFANYFPGYEHIADPLIDRADFGMKASSLRALFARLREKLVPIVQAITSQAPAEAAFMKEAFPKEGQMEFSRMAIKRLGYDYSRGRDDLARHPFTTSFSQNDVRITTRVNEHDLGDCLFSMIHEAGHGMYEQGVNPAYEGTPLANGTSAGVHESQSRLWENVVGRSRGFWEYFYPDLQKTFPHLEKVGLDAFYRAINKVEKSLIRTEADEVTYNLHIMLRLDFELQLLEGSLAVGDLPEAWRERFQLDLGVLPPDDKDGVLQDIHWYAGIVGGVFQGYTLGNIMCAQFFAAALKAHPEIPDEMKQGKFDTLHNWLIENIYRHGRKFTAPELVKRVTGSEISIEPYVEYLRTKYGGLYQL